MKTYKIYRKQQFSCTLDELWHFISTPRNLARITPSYMQFKIMTHPLPDIMYAGQIIEYTVRPLLNIPLRWVTEITAVEEKKYFIDEQRSGPYRFWHHEHWLHEIDGKIIMEDTVIYSLPLGLIGQSLHSLFIRKQLEDIFNFRYQKLYEVFPS